MQFKKMKMKNEKKQVLRYKQKNWDFQEDFREDVNDCRWVDIVILRYGQFENNVLSTNSINYRMYYRIS